MKYPIEFNTRKKEPIRREDGGFTQAVTTFRNRVRLRHEETGVCQNTTATTSTSTPTTKTTTDSEPKRDPLRRVSVSLTECFETKNGFRYEVVGKLGEGVFGQVLKCVSSVKASYAGPGMKPEEKAAPEIDEENGLELLFNDSEEGESRAGVFQDKDADINMPEFVAVKVIDNRPKYYHQGKEEIRQLRKVLQEEQNYEYFPIVKLFDNFEWNGHLCLVFEVLSMDLLELYRSYDLLKGVPFRLLRPIVRQLLVALEILYNNSIIHCDLKPENILLEQDFGGEEIRVKLIDFGSAIGENRGLLDNIQTIYYRAPEVILGQNYDCSIDMWSLGCVMFELFAGYPLFPGKTDHDMLWLMRNAMGDIPDAMAAKGRHCGNYFCKIQKGGRWRIYLKSRENWAKENDLEPKKLKTIFSSRKSLDEVVLGWSYRDVEDADNERNTREAFADLCEGLLQYNPSRRWSPMQARDHPFLCDDPYEGPYNPHESHLDGVQHVDEVEAHHHFPQSQSQSQPQSQSQSMEIYGGALQHDSYGMSEYAEPLSSSWIISPPMRPQYPMPYYFVSPYQVHPSHATSFPNSWQGGTAYHYLETMNGGSSHQAAQQVGSLPVSHHYHYTSTN